MATEENKEEFNPTLISVSGGRSSGYALFKCIESGLAFAPETFAVFADTGMEFPETYTFLDAMEKNWGVKIHRVSYPQKHIREGETPYDAMIRRKKYLPNHDTRFCTEELKVVPCYRFMRQRKYKKWDVILGYRADEPTRIAKKRTQNASGKYRQHYIFPLVSDGIEKKEVMEFWKQQSFDLGLPSAKSTITLCFEKGEKILTALIQQDPSLAAWWIEKEAEVGAMFKNRKKGGKSYAEMKEIALSMPPTDCASEEDWGQWGGCGCKI